MDVPVRSVTARTKNVGWYSTTNLEKNELTMSCTRRVAEYKRLTGMAADRFVAVCGKYNVSIEETKLNEAGYIDEIIALILEIAQGLSAGVSVLVVYITPRRPRRSAG